VKGEKTKGKGKGKKGEKDIPIGEDKDDKEGEVEKDGQGEDEEAEREALRLQQEEEQKALELEQKEKEIELMKCASEKEKDLFILNLINDYGLLLKERENIKNPKLVLNGCGDNVINTGYVESIIKNDNVEKTVPQSVTERQSTPLPSSFPLPSSSSLPSSSLIPSTVSTLPLLSDGAVASEVSSSQPFLPPQTSLVPADPNDPDTLSTTLQLILQLFLNISTVNLIFPHVSLSLIDKENERLTAEHNSKLVISESLDENKFVIFLIHVHIYITS
jgi:hypothetical protein